MFQQLISTSSPAAQSNSPGFGAIIFWVIAVAVFALIVWLMARNTGISGQPEDEKYYLREIRKYVRIIAIVLVGVVFFTVASWIFALI